MQFIFILSSKPERRGSDASLRSTSSEVLCNSLYENNAGYSTDSLASTWSLEGSVKSETSSGEEMYDDSDSQDVDGVFDTLIYIGNSNICCCIHCLIIPIMKGFRIMVFTATFNNISIIFWRSVLLVKEIGVTGTYYEKTV